MEQLLISLLFQRHHSWLCSLNTSVSDGTGVRIMFWQQGQSLGLQSLLSVQLTSIHNLKPFYITSHKNHTCTKALSTGKTQLFCYGYSYCPHVYDENNDWKFNFSKTLSRVDFLKMIMCTAYLCGHLKMELFNNDDITLLVPVFIPKSKTADTRFTLLSFVFGPISSLIACFQINLSLLNIHTDYLRSRGDIRKLAL